LTRRAVRGSEQKAGEPERATTERCSDGEPVENAFVSYIVLRLRVTLFPSGQGIEGALPLPPTRQPQAAKTAFPHLSLRCKTARISNVPLGNPACARTSSGVGEPFRHTYTNLSN